MGIDEEMEQKRREWLLDVDVAQVKMAAEKLDHAMQDASVTLLGERKRFIKDEDWVLKDLGIVPPTEVAGLEAGESAATAAA